MHVSTLCLRGLQQEQQWLDVFIVKKRTMQFAAIAGVV